MAVGWLLGHIADVWGVGRVPHRRQGDREQKKTCKCQFTGPYIVARGVICYLEWFAASL